MKIFTKERMLTPSWSLLPLSFELLKKYVWHAVYLSFAPLLLLSVSTLVLSTIPNNATELTTAQMFGVLLFFVSLIWYIMAAPGFIVAQVSAMRGREISVGDAFRRGLSKLLPLIGLSILSSLLIALGLVAFIIPGLILMRGLLLAQYYLIDTELGVVGSLKKSYEDSKPVTAWIWGLIGVIFALSFVGGLLGRIAVVGQLLSLLIVYPYIFAPALRYGEIVKAYKPAARKED